MGVEERNRIQGYSLSFVNAILMTSLGLRSVGLLDLLVYLSS
jgi:hypothetical protein